VRRSLKDRGGADGEVSSIGPLRPRGVGVAGIGAQALIPPLGEIRSLTLPPTGLTCDEPSLFSPFDINDRDRAVMAALVPDESTTWSLYSGSQWLQRPHDASRNLRAGANMCIDGVFDVTTSTEALTPPPEAAAFRRRR